MKLEKLSALLAPRRALRAKNRAYRAPRAIHFQKLGIDRKKHRGDHGKGGDDCVLVIALRHERPIDRSKQAIDRSKQAIDRSKSRALRFAQQLDRHLLSHLYLHVAQH